jgi:hypothetical protein
VEVEGVVKFNRMQAALEGITRFPDATKRLATELSRNRITLDTSKNL